MFQRPTASHHHWLHAVWPLHGRLCHHCHLVVKPPCWYTSQTSQASWPHYYHRPLSHHRRLSIELIIKLGILFINRKLILIWHIGNITILIPCGDAIVQMLIKHFHFIFVLISFFYVSVIRCALIHEMGFPETVNIQSDINWTTLCETPIRRPRLSSPNPALVW